jgi:hypothetical protein
MAMEFAITAPGIFAGADDSWQPSGSRSFLFDEPQAILWCARTGQGMERHCVLR